MDKKETGIKLLNTILWSGIAYIVGRFITTPAGQFIETKINTLNLGFKNPMDQDNIKINSVQEGQYINIPTLANKNVATTENAEGYINPFTEELARISWKFDSGIQVGKLTGMFAKFKGVTYAEVLIPDKGKAWMYISKIKTI